MKKLTDLANSEKGKELQEKAKKIANDPENREKLEVAKKKITDKMGGGSKTADGGPDAGPATTPTADAEPPDSRGAAEPPDASAEPPDASAEPPDSRGGGTAA